MPSTFQIPDYGVTIYAEPNRPRAIFPGQEVRIDGGNLSKAAVHITRPVFVEGKGATVVVHELDDHGDTNLAVEAEDTRLPRKKAKPE